MNCRKQEITGIGDERVLRNYIRGCQCEDCLHPFLNPNSAWYSLGTYLEPTHADFETIDLQKENT